MNKERKDPEICGKYLKQCLNKGKNFVHVMGASHVTGKKFVNGEVWIRKSEGFRWVFKSFEMFVKVSDLVDGEVFSGTQAASYIKDNFGEWTWGRNLKAFVFFSPCVLCLVFSNEEEGLAFERFLNKTVELGVRVSVTQETPRNKNFSVLTAFGAVFDIVEVGAKDEMWAEFQVTFIDEDSSRSERVLFDKSQSNLLKSVQQAESVYRDQLDSINFQILDKFLVDVSRAECLARVTRMGSVKKVLKIVVGLETSRKENSRMRNAFLNVDQKLVTKDSHWLMRKIEETKKSDEVGALLCCVYLQKLEISMEMCEVAVGYKELEARKSVDSVTCTLVNESLKTGKRSSVSKSPIRRHARVDSPLHKVPNKKSFFREACNCGIV